MSMKGSLQRVVVWRNLIAPGCDYCSLWRVDPGWLLKGTAIAVLKEHGAVLAEYEVHCDEDWRTRSVEVRLTQKGQTRTLELVKGGAETWSATQHELPEVAGCVDIDLAITPATNTLPLRRLNIPIGHSQQVTAAWIRFPTLDVRPLQQRYTRLSANTYRYESDSGFVSEIVVDELGLVISYKNAWERV